MAASFLHGVETVVIENGPVPVSVVRTNVISLVGTAPEGEVNSLKLVTNPVDAAQFGSKNIPGYTIPKALDAIFAQGAGQVLVVNVTDGTDHFTDVTGESADVESGKASLTYYPQSIDSIENQAAETLSLNTHYTVNNVGQLVFTNRALTGVSEVRASGSFTITGGTNSAGVNKITSITVNSVNILSAAVDWVTSNAATAAAIKSNADAHTSTPEYEVTVVGATVTIKAKAGTGATPNGFDVVVTVGGDVTVDDGTFDLTGGVTAETATTAVTVDYSYFDISNVTAADINGEVTAGTRTGMELFDEAYSTFGVTPKLIVAPEFSQLLAVQAQLLVKAGLYRAKALIDGQEGWTATDAIADRGPAGGVFNTTDKNALLCYPKVKRYDPFTDADELFPSSVYHAGVIAANPNYWESASNRIIKGITGVERILTHNPVDASGNTETNLLNAAGIITIGGGKSWGNRSASFPTSTAVTNFYCVDRTANIIDESLELATVQFIDKPITQPLIDSIRETGNQFMRVLKSRGAIIDGVVSYDPAKNPPVQLAAGQIVYDVSFLPPTPAERITYERVIDINFFNNLA